ncbi:MAG: hypothetical protein R3E98_02420 [Gemmatimonadota bacterium]
MDGTGILATAGRSAAEVARELRREFEAALYQRTGAQAKPDPVLATLFHALAVQVAHVYDEAEQVFPITVLDDLTTGLGLEPRLAAPAQTVVQFTGVERRERLALDTELRGYNRKGEPMGFLPDETVELQPSELVFAAVYERGHLHTVPGARIANGGPPVPPGSVPVELAQASPGLFLAVAADESHVGGLGVFLDVSPADGPLAEALRRAPWQILSSDGTVVEAGTLRSRPGRAGVRLLDWVDRNGAETGVDDDEAAHLRGALALPGGFYGGLVQVLPPVPRTRRFRCRIPEALSDAVPRLLPPEHAQALDVPHVWIHVPLPHAVGEVAPALHRAAINCVSASNVEVFNERIVFERTGTVVGLRPEGKVHRHLMGVVGVRGEHGAPYVPDANVDAPLEHGRWRLRGGTLELRPGRSGGGRPDRYAMVRLLYCDAEDANGLAPGDLRQVAGSIENITARVANLTTTRGGAAPPAYADARLRFAEQLRSRGRLVTAPDFEIAARAFEPRITDVEVDSRVERTPEGVRQVERVRVRVPAESFADVEAESLVLRERLEDHLRQRMVLGHGVRVEVHT